MIEQDILYHAVENLRKWVQMPIDIRYLELQPKNIGVDAILKIGDKKEYPVEIKKEIHASNLPNILKQLSRLFIEFPLLVAQSISTAAKDILQRENINYLDMAGNCLIRNDSGLYIQIEGKKAENIVKKRKHIAFNKNGIKLIYTLLINEILINQSYEEMAKAANISKSTVGSILNDLKDKGFLIQVKRKVKKLINQQALQEKWVTAYQERLKPSLFRGRFRFLKNDSQNWKKLDLKTGSFWGGEPAADILTDYLFPSEWTLYSNNNKSTLLKKLQLVPDPISGNISVYTIFWNIENEFFIKKNKQIVHPLLVYTDLIGSQDNRNFEVAKKIYEQTLSTNH